MTARAGAATLPILAVLLGAAAPADLNRSVVILGNGQARECEQHAKLAADRMMSPAHAEATCSEALAIEQLSPSDRAATLNNRGVVRFAMLDEPVSAMDDFTAAADVNPRLGTSYVNRGTVFLREQRFEEARAELDRGIELGNIDEPWKAYYNRALAREALNDVRGAYDDFMKALELNPGWEMATAQLSRFTVRQP